MSTFLPITSAFRLALLRRVQPEDVPASAQAVLALLVAYAILPTLEAIANSGAAPGRFDIQYLSHALFPVAVLVAGAALAAWRLGATALFPRLLAAVLLAGLVIELIQFLLLQLAFHGEDTPARSWMTAAIPILPSIWLALALWRFAAGMGAITRRRRLGLLAALLAAVTLPIWKVDYYPSLWQPDLPDATDAAAPKHFPAAREEVLYAQPKLLQGAIEGVRRGEPGKPEVFLLAIAGYGQQDVFMKEVDAVSALFQERFGAEGRTVKLINNPRTVLTHPFANVTSVRAALAGLAAKMDPEDVVFIFMTSHGTEQHRFSLLLPPLQFQELTPAVLREALDDARIRNRVVVVSACYSGGFIEPLRGPNTLVITASAADRNSFGCSNTAEWTYFGKAYFDEALRGTRSFTGAFEAAQPVVLARERKENHPPSMPQMAVGEGIVPVLEALERTLPP